MILGGGFGPRPPDTSTFGPYMQKRADNYADMLTKNNQQRVSEPLIPIAAPTIYRAPDPVTFKSINHLNICLERANLFEWSKPSNSITISK